MVLILKVTPYQELAYLRNTMGQGRLCASALLSIEALSAELMKTEKLWTIFHLLKHARRNFSNDSSDCECD